jgi:phthiocerol/phenolphthiocerol synthesis type-I polyketide synthase C
MVPKPEQLSYGVAAATPTVHVTVFAAFEGIAPGSRVLVHAGTGGVGLAAVGVARTLGCSVVATAGSAAKRGYLRRRGVGVVADSRSTSFLDAVISALGPCDAALNSLTSPGKWKSISTGGQSAV